MKKKTILLFLIMINILNASNLYTWKEANNFCKKQNKRLPNIDELIKIKSILSPGLYWADTPLKQNKNNYEYWIIQLKKDGTYIKGVLPEGNEITFTCVKANKNLLGFRDEKKELNKFKYVYKEKVIVFPVGSLSFIQNPLHIINKKIYPYNFYQFRIYLTNSIPLNKMKKLEGHIASYDTILMGKILNVKKLDKYGHEYIILSTPTNLLEPYFLPDNTIRAK